MKLLQHLAKNKDLPYYKAVCIITVCIVASQIDRLLGFIGRIVHFFSPVLMGIILAFVLDMIAGFIQTNILARIPLKRKIKKIISVWGAVVLIIGIMALITVILIPELVSSISTLAEGFEEYKRSIELTADHLLDSLKSNSGNINIRFKPFHGTMNKLLEYMPWKNEEGISMLLEKSINMGKSTADFVISFIIAIYMTFEKDVLKRRWEPVIELIITPRRWRKAKSILEKTGMVFSKYITGNIIDSSIVGIANFVFMSVVGIDYAVLVSVVVGVTNLAPTFGPIAGVVIGTVIISMSGSWHVFWFLLFAAVIQFADAFIIKPKLFGNTFGVSPLWILVSIILLGRGFGVLGILVAIPIAALTDIFYKDAFLYFMQIDEEDSLETSTDEKPDGS